MKQKNFFYHRMIFYISGLLIMSVGSNLFLKAALGVAPSCTVALTLTYLFPFHSYASFNFLINTAFLVGEVFVLRQFRKSQIIQLALTFLYSVFIECTSWGLFFIQPEGLLQKISLAFLACVILSIGVAFTINSGFAVMPMEGLVKSIADKTHHSFGVIRVLLELSLTAGSAVVAFTFLHNLSPIGIATVLTAFLSGNITNLFSFLFGKKMQAFLGV